MDLTKYVIKFNSNSEKSTIKLFEYYVNFGYILLRAYSKRDYFIFGEKRYYIEMVMPTINIISEIDKAIMEERYEDAENLKQLMTKTNSVKFN